MSSDGDFLLEGKCPQCLEKCIKLLDCYECVKCGLEWYK